LQWTATDEDADLDERFVVGPPRTEVGIIFVRLPRRKNFWRFEDEQSELHRHFSLGTIVSAFALLNV
jgi:hypothetical protein